MFNTQCSCSVDELRTDIENVGLLEQRGIVNPATAAAATGPKDEDDHKAAHAEKVSSDKASSDKVSTGSPDPKEKHSLKDKIKAKLHKN